jgi:hypothetical protein
MSMLDCVDWSFQQIADQMNACGHSSNEHSWNVTHACTAFMGPLLCSGGPKKMKFEEAMASARAGMTAADAQRLDDFLAWEQEAMLPE